MAKENFSKLRKFLQRIFPRIPSVILIKIPADTVVLAFRQIERKISEKNTFWWDYNLRPRILRTGAVTNSATKQIGIRPSKRKLEYHVFYNKVLREQLEKLMLNMRSKQWQKLVSRRKRTIAEMVIKVHKRDPEIKQRNRQEESKRSKMDGKENIGWWAVEIQQ